MKGYAYLDLDGVLYYKTSEYIETDNPNFWFENQEFIIEKWCFDTENKDLMVNMFFGFKRLALKADVVNRFLASINYTPLPATPTIK
jgi:hypothetical protein